jgi:hypothetical protein
MSRFPEDVTAGAIGQDCGKYASVGSRCVKPMGHTDVHLSAYGWQWTDESDRNAAAAIAKSMEGKRD